MPLADTPFSTGAWLGRSGWLARLLAEVAAMDALTAACAALSRAGSDACARGGWLAGLALLPLSASRWGDVALCLGYRATRRSPAGLEQRRGRRARARRERHAHPLAARARSRDEATPLGARPARTSLLRFEGAPFDGGQPMTRAARRQRRAARLRRGTRR